MVNIEDIEAIDRQRLCEVWFELIGNPPPKSLSISMMKRVIANEVQLKGQGGLDPKTLRAIRKQQGRATDERDENGSRKSLRMRAGSRLMREWNGVTHVVEVVDKGFLWEGQRYRSLSAIAKSITGAHWSGPRFFGLDKAQAKRGIAVRAIAKRATAHV